ncbi:hypothetical protein GEV33_012948 [Tenebrio molitor]|uniref:Uncharacterized protein n=1 Tax=Tenebrio molitor TaxID=7067 RepID=A0A8J6L8H3_TENMO|nr:hypothetical protein GEV33_012948 [Tenebrio molitor]
MANNNYSALFRPVDAAYGCGHRLRSIKSEQHIFLLKGYIFHSPPKGGRAAEAFQSLFSHTDGKIRDGYGEDECGMKVVDYFADQARVTERLGVVRLASLNRISKDFDPPSPTNRFPTKPRNPYNLDGGFTSTSRSRISEDLGPPPLTALHNRRPHRNLTKQPPDLLNIT